MSKQLKWDAKAIVAKVNKPKNRFVCEENAILTFSLPERECTPVLTELLTHCCLKAG